MTLEMKAIEAEGLNSLTAEPQSQRVDLVENWHENLHRYPCSFELDLRGPILKSGLNEGGAFDGAFFNAGPTFQRTRGI